MVRRLIRQWLSKPAPVEKPRPVWTGQVLPGSEPPPDVEVETPVPGSVLLDIREPGELTSGVAEGAILLPMDLVPHHVDELPPKVTVYCAAGARSFGVAHWLRDQGIEAYSLSGGVWGVGVPLVKKPEAGRHIKLPTGTTLVGLDLAGMDAEIIAGRQARVRDDAGFWVRVELPAEEG